MSTNQTGSVHERWAHLRFAVVGPLLASPPKAGELMEQLRELSAKSWEHPSTGLPTKFGVSTIERWYYQAKNERLDPVARLKRRPRKDLGQIRAMSPKLRQALLEQYQQHRSWTMQLHSDNLEALVKQSPDHGPMCSYQTVRRYMKSQGLRRVRKPKKARGQSKVRQKENREVRSYENDYVGGLWHLDFHHCSRKIVTPDGAWVTPVLLGVLDDHSRLGCHVQWYLHETAENLIHGLGQAILKRGLPRALMTDNGAAMTATETTQGLGRLGVILELTLPYSPYQNAKQEVFWAQVEGRLMPMLENVDDLSLTQLNEATQAWVEMEYQRKKHDEIGVPPLTRFAESPSVMRESPPSKLLAQAFTQEITRKQRRSDGTITVDGVRFELPSRYRHLERVTVRYASWDLRHVLICDGKTGNLLCQCFPLDKSKNADGVRRALGAGWATDSAPAAQERQESGELPPLLRQLLDDYNGAGLAPAYLAKNETQKGTP